jgi:hypothetical protein
VDEIEKAIAALAKPKRPRLKAVPGAGKVSAPTTWGLVLDKDGKPQACLHNAIQLLRHAHPTWGTLRYDEFSGRMLTEDGRSLEESDELQTCAWLQQNHNPGFGLPTASHALRALGFSRRYDALVDHVRAVKWDGVSRVDTFLVRYLGASDLAYHRAVGRVWLLSMAARALKPGCKVDTVPILEGEQGIRKSTVCEIIGGPFFAELEGAFGTKDAAEQVEGAWLVEIGELQSLAKPEANAVKAFVSRRADRFRRAYGRSVTDVPRRSVMVGTTNADTYLRDETGSRRFLPARLGTIDLPALQADRDQLVAEAVARVDAGESWWITDQAELTAQKNATADRYEADVWADDLASFLAIRPRVTVSECLSHLRVEVQNKAGHLQARCSKLLVFLGYRRVRFQSEPGRPWAYVRGVTQIAMGFTPSKDEEMGFPKHEQNHSVTPSPHLPHHIPMHTQAQEAEPMALEKSMGSMGSLGFAEVSWGGEMGSTPSVEDDAAHHEHAFSDLLDEPDGDEPEAGLGGG